MSKVLIATSVASMVEQFLMPNIQLFQEMGYEVHVACNFFNGNTCSEDIVDALKRRLVKENVLFHQINFARNVANISEHICAYQQLVKLIDDNKYEIVHCHSPIGGLITRFVCRNARKYGTKVFYTAHGFHFYKGAPLRNWLLFYPVEKICAHFTDVLITINQEDYALAQKKMKAKRVEYVPGVGIDLSKFNNASENKEEIRRQKREELGIPQDAILLLSVGELNKNKNHQVILQAMAKLKNMYVYYAIAGRGKTKKILESVASKYNLSQNLYFLGYRTDIYELCNTADIFCFPSYREGLGMAAIEAMACGLPIITSNVHGINDYSENDVTGYKCAPNDINSFAIYIDKLIKNPEMRKQFGTYNCEFVMKYDVGNIFEIMRGIYEREVIKDYNG